MKLEIQLRKCSFKTAHYQTPIKIEPIKRIHQKIKSALEGPNKFKDFSQWNNLKIPTENGIVMSMTFVLTF